MTEGFLVWAHRRGLRCWCAAQGTPERIDAALHHISANLWVANEVILEYDDSSNADTMTLTFQSKGDTYINLSLKLTKTMWLLQASVDELEFPDRQADDPSTTVIFLRGCINFEKDYNLYVRSMQY